MGPGNTVRGPRGEAVDEVRSMPVLIATPTRPRLSPSVRDRSRFASSGKRPPVPLPGSGDHDVADAHRLDDARAQRDVTGAPVTSESHRTARSWSDPSRRPRTFYAVLAGHRARPGKSKCSA